MHEFRCDFVHGYFYEDDGEESDFHIPILDCSAVDSIALSEVVSSLGGIHRPALTVTWLLTSASRPFSRSLVGMDSGTSAISLVVCQSGEIRAIPLD
jgi:hypothetical protein